MGIYHESSQLQCKTVLSFYILTGIRQEFLFAQIFLLISSFMLITTEPSSCELSHSDIKWAGIQGTEAPICGHAEYGCTVHGNI